MSPLSHEKMTAFLDEQVRLDRAVNEAWCALRAAIIERHSAFERASPRNGRICAIARKLYAHRHGTEDADYPVMTQAPRIDGKGASAIWGPFAPAWATYCQDADEFLRIAEGMADVQA